MNAQELTRRVKENKDKIKSLRDENDKLVRDYKKSIIGKTMTIWSPPESYTGKIYSVDVYNDEKVIRVSLDEAKIHALFSTENFDKLMEGEHAPAKFIWDNLTNSEGD